MMVQTEISRVTGDILEALAESAGLSRSKFIAEILEEYVADDTQMRATGSDYSPNVGQTKGE